MRGAWRSFSGALDQICQWTLLWAKAEIIAGNASYVADADIAAEENPPAKVASRSTSAHSGIMEA